MIHYSEISELQQRIADMQDTILSTNPSAERETNMWAEIDELEEEVKRLTCEQDEYREGYDAGVSFHMGGEPMRDEWCGRFGFFQQGFDAAGWDS